MEGAPVADGPGHKGQERKETGDERNAHGFFEPPRAAAIHQEGRPEDYGQQGAIRAQQSGVAPGKGQQGCPKQPRAIEQFPQGEKTQGYAEDGKGFGECEGDVICRKRTKGRQQEREAGGSWATQFPGQPRSEQASAKVNQDLDIDHGTIVCCAEKGKA